MSTKGSIQTPRLILRSFRRDDFNAVHSYGSNLDVVRYTTFGPNTEQDTRDFITRSIAEVNAEPRLNYNYAVVYKSDNRLIGGVGVMIASLENRSAELGYVFHKDAWGHGYATEAARALLDLAFGHLNMHRVFARCFAENAASENVMKKLGMQYEGRMRDDIWRNGAWHDVLIYAILAKD